MPISIQNAYDISVDLVKKGEKVEAAIYHALQREIDYEHDAQRMLQHWHEFRLPPYDRSKGGYPI